MADTKAIAKREAEPTPDGFMPSNVQQALWFAEQLFESRLLPAHVESAQAAFAIIVTGHELGLSPMQSLRSIHVIEGKPALSADIMVALCLGKTMCERFEVMESTNAIATYETQRSGQKPVRLSFTIEDAKTAGLLGRDNWRKYPAAMLRARAASALARAVYPDVVAGVYTDDELGTQPPLQAKIEQSEPLEPAQPADDRARVLAGLNAAHAELGADLYYEVVGEGWKPKSLKDAQDRLEELEAACQRIRDEAPPWAEEES